MHSILVWTHCARSTARAWHDIEAINIWYYWGVMEAQFLLIVVFSLSELLGLVCLIFLLTVLHRFSVRFRSGKFIGQSSNNLAVWAGVLQEYEIRLSAEGRALDLIKHCGPTSANDRTRQIITDSGNFTWIEKTTTWDSMLVHYFYSLQSWNNLKTRLWATAQQSSAL